MIDLRELVLHARTAAEHAYAPFSRFRVGAAVSAGGAVFAGCNIENASYGLTICAERNAIFHAVASGCRRIDAIALACVDTPADAASALTMPCGACRQVMAEFAAANTPIVIDGVRTFQLFELLPQPFALIP